MQLKLARGFLPCLLRYTDNLPEGVGGHTWHSLPLVEIRPAYAADVGIHEHELTHVAQWYAWLAVSVVIAAALALAGVLAAGDAVLNGVLIGAALNPLLYTAVPWVRLHAEVAAYRRQSQYYPDDTAEQRAWRLDYFGIMIATRYGVKIDVAQAQQLLRE